MAATPTRARLVDIEATMCQRSVLVSYASQSPWMANKLPPPAVAHRRNMVKNKTLMSSSRVNMKIFYYKNIKKKLILESVCHRFRLFLKFFFFFFNTWTGYTPTWGSKALCWCLGCPVHSTLRKEKIQVEAKVSAYYALKSIKWNSLNGSATKIP